MQDKKDQKNLEQYHSSTVVPLLKDTLERIPHYKHIIKDTHFWQQVPVVWVPLILTLPKGHLPNEDRIIWHEGCCPY